jgi:hypothetical protein
MPKFPKSKGYKSPIKNKPFDGPPGSKATEMNNRHYKFAHVDGKAANPHKENVQDKDTEVKAKEFVAGTAKKPAPSYAPFKMKSPIKDKSTDEHPHVHLKREIKVRKCGGEIKVRQSERVAQYAPFKMKHAGGNPMKANFKSAFKQVDDIKNPVAGASPMKGHMHTDNLPDGRSRSAAFQLHDGKKFEDAGFMDTHFPSGKPRTPAKQLDDKEKGKKIVRRMKQIEAKLAKNGNLSEEKKKKLKDELLKLSTTIRGQEYTDTGK